MTIRHRLNIWLVATVLTAAFGSAAAISNVPLPVPPILKPVPRTVSLNLRQVALPGVSSTRRPEALLVSPSASNIVLNWTNSLYVNSYKIYRATTSGGPFNSSIGISLGSTFTDSTATGGIVYWYEVTALNDLGESNPAGPVSAQLQTTPSVTNYVPAVGTSITKSTQVQFDVLDASGLQLTLVTIVVSGKTEVIYDGTRFTPNYLLSSSVSAISNGLRFIVLPNAGWSFSVGPKFSVYVVNKIGKGG